MFQMRKRNFYFKNKLAYTEDHVLVKSLFLVYIAAELDHTHLRKHFQSFGRVVRLQVFRDNKPKGGGQSKSRSGYVLFANPRHAANALMQKVHYVNKRRLSVQPSDSWHQPDSRNPRNVDPNEPPAAILNLNDHCLEHILCKLSLIDRIHFARTCNRFRNVYQGMSPSLDKSITFESFETMTMWDIRDFFQLSGKHVKEIKGFIPQRHCKRLCEFLGMHCINLHTMNISGNKLTKGNLLKLFAKVNNLQNLMLHNCSLSNDCLTAISKLGQLKTLDISTNDRLTGQCTDNLPVSIEVLTVNNCAKFMPNKLSCSKLFGRLSHLKELHTKGIFLHTIIKDIVNDKLLESLEILTISTGDHMLASEYKHIAKLPSLKKLTVIFHMNFVPPMFFEWLAEHKSHQLETLKILAPNCIKAGGLVEIGKLIALRSLHLTHNSGMTDSDLEALFTLQNLEEISIQCCDNVTDNGVLRLILACPKLQVLHLEGCEQLTGKLLQDIIYKLKTNQSQRTLPIKLNMYDNDIDKEFILTNPDVVAKNIIDVSYPVHSMLDRHDLRPNMLLYDDLFDLDDDDDDDLFEFDDDDDDFGSDDFFDSEFDEAEPLDFDFDFGFG